MAMCGWGLLWAHLEDKAVYNGLASLVQGVTACLTEALKEGAHIQRQILVVAPALSPRASASAAFFILFLTGSMALDRLLFTIFTAQTKNSTFSGR